MADIISITSPTGREASPAGDSRPHVHALRRSVGAQQIAGILGAIVDGTAAHEPATRHRCMRVAEEAIGQLNDVRAAVATHHALRTLTQGIAQHGTSPVALRDALEAALACYHDHLAGRQVADERQQLRAQLVPREGA